ncbi:pirin family protein [Bowmanella dokdonensis]|uniref:Pirin family protein n=1 Tax=Bowmanella dokdonensis TaxID=751969 RepID=A0A939INS5_9ALTE|nr:pirin family protein [Bowmanella dokdonensis]MBN7825150.1 pirin family protein [Bowmanella dokdonensis]
MTNLLKETTGECEQKSQSCEGIEMIIEPKERDLGGLSVRRALPTAKLRSVGPWIFFDHMGPVEFEAGKGIDVRPHPHINLATVTYLFEGEILHRDSLANLQPIKPGDINLMVAGSGIVHSERERPQVREEDHKLHGLQLWHALPEEYEEIPPAFYHYGVDDIPTARIGEVTVRVMIGKAYSVESPVKTFCNTLYLEAFLEPGQSLTLPMVEQSALYVASGAVKIHQTTVDEHNLALLTPNSQVRITAELHSRIVLFGGEPLGERFMYWNFASSRKERVQQAMDDWEAQRFVKVPDDADEFIPLPKR